MKQSTYDKMFEAMFSSNLKKSGTRYERLAAYVFKSLHSEDVIIHDIKLIGDSDVKHQIDVTVQVGKSRKRVIIECKDFDISGNKVGLGIVRNFWGVIDDIHPDEGIVITCNGFTRDAVKYAKSKNIKLAILREFQESDWEGRIKTLCINMNMMHISEPTLGLHFDKQENLDKFKNDLEQVGLEGSRIRRGQPVYLNLPKGRIQIHNYIDKVSNEYPRDKPGPVVLKPNIQEATIEVENRGGVSIAGLSVNFEIFHSEQYFEIESDKIAKLILEDLEGTDIVVCEEDLIRLDVNKETGEIQSTTLRD